MYDIVVMQVEDTGRNSFEPMADHRVGEAVRISVDDIVQAVSTNELHHDPRRILGIMTNIVELDEVRVSQVQALLYASQFDIKVPLNSLQRDLFAGFGGGTIDLAESANSDAPLNDKIRERPISRRVPELFWSGS